MRAIYLREIKAFLDSLIGYMVIAVFLVAIGLLFWVFPDTSILQYGYATMDQFFNLTPYIFLFLIPAITMRSFAEDKKTGMLEILLTSPVSLFDLIQGKFLAAVTLVLIALVPTLTYVVSLHYLANPVGNIDLASITGSYVGLILLGVSFAAIGILTSSLTENQIIAFLIAVFISFLLYTGVYSLAQLPVLRKVAVFVENISLVHHYDALSRGVLDIRNMLYLLTVAGVALSATYYNLANKKW